MIITRAQLRRIIKEAKKKLQEQQSPGDRAMGMYADMKAMTNAEAAMEEFMVSVIDAAEEDLGGGDDEYDNEAYEYGRLALIELFSKFASNYGFNDIVRALKSADGYQSY
tara:strand:- start:16027 stop:16356 length:330 start_codon:yes stop_codon:yes gene_type:complete